MVHKELEDYVESWGGEWQPRIGGGSVAIPVAAGLRHGLIEGRLVIVAEGEGSRVTFEVEKSRYWLNWSAIVILGVGASGGILLLLWPLFPRLLALAPVAALAAFSAWFLVNARLSNSGPREFLEGLRLETEAGGDGPGA